MEDDILEMRRKIKEEQEAIKQEREHKNDIEVCRHVIDRSGKNSRKNDSEILIKQAKRVEIGNFDIQKEVERLKNKNKKVRDRLERHNFDEVDVLKGLGFVMKIMKWSIPLVVIMYIWSKISEAISVSYEASATLGQNISTIGDTFIQTNSIVSMLIFLFPLILISTIMLKFLRIRGGPI